MFRRFVIAASLGALSAGCADVNRLATDLSSDVQAQMNGESPVVGTVEVLQPFPGWATCFKGVQGSAISRRPISRLADAEGFPALVVSKSGVASGGACAELQKNGLLILRAEPVGGSASPARGTAFVGTELYRFFERYPQPGGGRSVSWPRVVITLLDEPAWGRDKLSQLNQFRPPSAGCWRFKARIWESENASRDLAPFQSCTDERLKIPGDDNHARYEVWSGLGLAQEKRGSTGVRRTEGPNFPDTPLPVSKRSNQARLNPVTFTGRQIEAVLYATGIDMAKFNDPRLWLNFAPALELD